MKQQSLFDEKTDINTLPLFAQSPVKVEDSKFAPKPAAKQPRLFGRETLEQMAASVKRGR